MDGEDEPGLWRCSDYTPGHGLTRLECLAVRQAVLHLSGQQGGPAASSRPPKVCWFPEYGCALVALGPPRDEGEGHDGDLGGSDSEDDEVEPPASTLMLKLVCPDGWECEPRSYHNYGEACPSG